MAKIETNIKNIIDKLSDLDKKQLPYAVMIATNNTAFDYMDKQKKEVKGILNWRKKIPNVIKINKATKYKTFAEIYVNEKNWGYYAIQQHFRGGDRHTKGLEKFMKSKKYLKSDENLIAVGKIRNIVSKNIIKEFSNKPKNFFIITSSMSSQKAGIYTKVTGHNKPILLFYIYKEVKYKKRFDMEKTLLKVYDRRGQDYFKKAIDYAIETAK
ncbi:MAG: hypothetical protein WA916_08895 [Arcobacter sp.]|uniref:hypothetical protein n=1 Tax=Arcobacter sp. TaxID=1872629 RepID=UPI003C707FAD